MTNPQGPKAELQLYDVAGNVFHSNAPNSGYTVNGEPCNTFSPAGDINCPIKFKVFWRAQCTASTCTATSFEAAEFVTVEMSYAPGSEANAAKINPLNYGLVEQNRLTFADQSSPALDCALRNKIFIGPNKVFNAVTADAQGGVDYTAFYGPRGDTGPAGPQG
ncbi:MAG: hypothetical protein HRT44_03005 [Bdellovibrionales bacterium]|nr:hypothetical protein [Bdellovibrionales bacterium]